MTNRQHVSPLAVAGIPVVCTVVFAAAWLWLPQGDRQRIQAELTRQVPLAEVQISNNLPALPEPLYNDNTVVSDEDLALVLHAVLPRFSQQRLRPNYVEHALRIWGGQIQFRNPDLISGPDMAGYLLDTGQYIASWGDEREPILQPNDDQGIYVRWASDRSASVHHDHMLASLAEAGVSLEQPVFTPARRTTLREIFAEALRDFRLDERETEWSAMAFPAWLAPQKTAAWKNSSGREITFDRMATRLMRSHKSKGVCLGIHRTYTLMMLVQLDDRYGDLISEQTRDRIFAFLSETRDLIMAAQSADGSWPPNWPDGASAEENRDPNEELYRRVIATGHHLEWLAIAPEELHPPRSDVRRAARWLVQNVQSSPQETIDSNYTFYSHVGNALALWRQTSPPEFWQEWRETHPDAEMFEETPPDQESTGQPAESSVTSPSES